MRNLNEDIDYILIDEAQLNARVQSLAREIEATYTAAGIGQITLLCLLKGGYVFMSDLSRSLNLPHEVDFMSVSSYGNATESSGMVKILLDLQQDIAGKHVLIVEDIIDSGLTLSKVLEILKIREPASVKLCALLSKPSRHKVPVKCDFLGFEVPDEFVVGYGLDFAQLYRNLPYIGVLKPKLFS